MATFNQNLKKVQAGRQSLQKAEDKLYQARLNIQREKNPDTLASVKRDLAATTAEVTRVKKQLHDAINILSERPQYTDIATELDAQIPILFLPVRIETRLVSKGNLNQLWLRVYPDDFHVASFEARLTAAEVDAGKTYWLLLLRANRENQENKEQVKQELWDKLVNKSGIQRTLWIVKQTMPANWEADLTVNDDELAFPASKDVKTHDWTLAPKTQILPDRFVVQIHNESRRVPIKAIIGNQVPDTVFTGPDPFLAEEAFKKDGKSITLDESFAWTSDFELAVKQGLGFKIEIKDEYLNRGKIDRITVMGLMASADPEESRAILEQHITAHRYSSKGFSFLPQGSATNNTGKSGSTYTENYDVLTNGYYDGSESVDISKQKNSDGHRFANALGINAEVFNGVRHADKQEIAEAEAMNTALYPATIGHFLEVLTEPAINKKSLPDVQKFFTENVSAIGPLSAIRVGDQPYGVLMTSDINSWHEKDKFDATLTVVLRNLQKKWNSMRVRKVAHVNKRGDASKLLLEILGLSAGSVSFKQRLAHLHDFSLSTPSLTNITAQLASKQSNIMKMLKGMGYVSASFPFISNLSFYNKNERINPYHMVDRKKPSTNRALDKLGTRKQNFIEWLSTAKQITDLEKHLLPGARPPRSVLYFLLRHSLLLELKKSALGVYNKKGYAYELGANEKSLYNFDKKVQDLTSWEILHGVPKKVDAIKLNINRSMGDYLLTLRSNNAAVRNVAQLRTALKRLAPLSTARLHQCLADHIDLCSYRLDAWQTGLFYHRLKRNRSNKSTGLYLGAYGWVENLKIVSKTAVEVPKALKPEDSSPVYHSPANAGFIHTPSLNHATAAGVLHAGYTQHASRTSPDTFAVNLSSERVRRALFIYEGVQNNQSLEALLGYQFERALHDITSENAANNLNQYILDLREKFPIEHSSIPQRGNEAQEAVPVYSVVNGLKIINAKKRDFKSLNITELHQNLLLKEKDRLADTLDAIGDLLTAESAYQMVQGKTDRTAAVLNSLKGAELPPELEVNKTPRSTHLTVSNKVCIQYSSKENIPLDAGWGAESTPRSMTEPGINSWLADQLGDPQKIKAAVSTVDEAGIESNQSNISIADLSLQPIDLVYAIGIDVQSGAEELEQMLYRHYVNQIVLPANSRVKIHFDVQGLAVDERSYAQVLPQLRLLRLMITTGYSASAKDFTQQSKKVNETPDDLFGWEHAELLARANNIINQLNAVINSINGKAPNSTQPKTAANPGTFKKLFENYFIRGKAVEVFEAMNLTDSAIQSLLSFQQLASLFGMRANVQVEVNKESAEFVVDLLLSVASVWTECNEKLQLANSSLQAANAATQINRKVTLLVEVIKSVVGNDFLVLPKFRFSNPDDVSGTVKEKGKILLKHIVTKQQTTAELAVETWLESTAPVRPNMARLEQIRMISEFSGGSEMPFIAAQIPYKKNDSWLSVEFPAEDEKGERFDITDNTISLCVHGIDKNAVNEPQAIMIIDEWTESIPNDKEVTGITYNYNQPNNCAPNALLLAVEPTGAAKWNWDRLNNILDDTLIRAKTRAVEPAHLLEDPALDTLTPMTIASFDLHNSGISLDFLMTNTKLINEMKAKNFELYKDFDN
ncbi:MAG: hypothetical protein L3J75_05370 [Methylococcaceae bacterium]|nr:hypothetical protein [Methylococcaceae bacterium]